MWNRDAGKKREVELPPFWPPQHPVEGEGMCGAVLAHGSFIANGDSVPSVTFSDCVVYEQDEVRRWRLRYVGDMTVAVSASLRAALAEARTPRGTVLQFTFTGTDAPKRTGMSGMKRFEVREVDANHLLGLYEQSQRQPQQ